MEGLILGPLTFRWGGLLLICGLLAGILLTLWRAKRIAEGFDLVLELLMPLLVWGMVGARLWHILTPPISSVQLGLTVSHYFSHPLDILSLWIGGYGIAGALLACAMVLFIFSRSNGLNYFELTDLFAPGMLLALAIGRVGNYFNQEIYGLPTDLPWGILIDLPHRLNGYEAVSTYHPLFAYEAGLSLLIVLAAFWIMWSRELPAGVLSAGLLAAYSLIRILLEFLRLDVSLAGGINVNQAFFLLTLVMTFAFLYRCMRNFSKL